MPCVLSIKIKIPKKTNFHDESIKATGAISADFYPAPMREMGLCGAVKWYVETMAPPKGINVTVDIGEVSLGMDGKKEMKELNGVAFHYNPRVH